MQAADRIKVNSPLCAKSGEPTSQRVTLRGSAMPSWVNVLPVFSFFAMLLAGAKTSRPYVIDLPLSREAHDKWRRGHLTAWVIGLIGGATFLFAALQGTEYPPVVGRTGVLVAFGGVIFGMINGYMNSVGVTLTRDHALLLKRVHPAFAASLPTSAAQVG